MPKYEVECAIPVFLTITVEAEDAEEADEIATEDMRLISFVGNGGSDRLVGTEAHNVSLSPGDNILEGEDFTVDVREVTE